MPFENNLRKLRQDDGKTIAELARISEVSDKTIRKIENRVINGKVETKSKIIKGLNKLCNKDFNYKDIFPHERGEN